MHDNSFYCHEVYAWQKKLVAMLVLPQYTILPLRDLLQTNQLQGKITLQLARYF
jgi:hypothetical protein